MVFFSFTYNVSYSIGLHLDSHYVLPCRLLSCLFKPQSPLSQVLRPDTRIPSDSSFQILLFCFSRGIERENLKHAPFPAWTSPPCTEFINMTVISLPEPKWRWTLKCLNHLGASTVYFHCSISQIILLITIFLLRVKAKVIEDLR